MIKSVTSKLFASGEFSDCSIKCQGKTFKVHRNIICLQSSVFKSGFASGFKEGLSQEYAVEDFDANTVLRMISFMYTDDYSDFDDDLQQIEYDKEPISTTLPDITVTEWKDEGTNSDVIEGTATEGVSDSNSISSTPTFETGPLFANAAVYVIAEYFDLPELKKLAKEKYEALLPTDWNSSSFVASLRFLYDNTSKEDNGLMEVAVQAAGEHVEELVDRGEFAELCHENGELAFDVLKASVHDTEENIICPKCTRAVGKRTKNKDRLPKQEHFCSHCRRYFTF